MTGDSKDNVNLQVSAVVKRSLIPKHAIIHDEKPMFSFISSYLIILAHTCNRVSIKGKDD